MPSSVTALVFNCHFNGLAVIRELGSHGVKVLALDARRSVGTYSRYACFQRCPDPLVDESGFTAYLMRLGHSFAEKPVLFPTNDHWAAAVSRHKTELSSYYRPCVADPWVVELILDKHRLSAWCQARGYPVPRTWSHDEWESIPASAFPMVAKPRCRRMPGNDSHGASLANRLDSLRLTRIPDARSLADFRRSLGDLEQFMCYQELVEGLSNSMYTVGVYVDNRHHVRAMFTGHKIRGFPPDVGDCMAG